MRKKNEKTSVRECRCRLPAGFSGNEMREGEGGLGCGSPQLGLQVVLVGVDNFVCALTKVIDYGACL